jgi:hypothetical protein
VIEKSRLTVKKTMVIETYSRSAIQKSAINLPVFISIENTLCSHFQSTHNYENKSSQRNPSE